MGRRIGTWGLVNYRTHPTNDRYKIFGYNTLPEANLMEEELKKRSIWCERGDEEHKNGHVYLVGVEVGDFKEAQLANFAVSAQYRNPMIKNKILRIALVTLTASMVTLAVIGYVKNNQKLNQETQKVEQE